MRYVRGRMRVVHISDYRFIAIPNGAALSVEIYGGYRIDISSKDIGRLDVSFSNAGDYKEVEARTRREYRRFIEWLTDGTGEFRFDDGRPAQTIDREEADTPARLVGEMHPPAPLPVAGEIDAMRGEVAP